MGRQASILKLKGSMGDLSFYFNKTYGYLVRAKGGPSSEKVKRDPQFARTRENASEFGGASKAGKLIRQAIQAALHVKGDSTITQRLTQELMRIVHLDMVHERGQRTVTGGIGEHGARDLLRSLAFVKDRHLDRVLKMEVDYAPVSGVFSFSRPLTKTDFGAPAAATHAVLQGATLFIDFATSGEVLFPTSAVRISLDDSEQTVVLSPATIPGGQGLQLGVLKVVFQQEQNREFYDLKEGEVVGVVY